MRGADGNRIIADGLTLKQRQLLLATVAKWNEESEEVARRPSWVRSGYYAHGAERRTARRIYALALVSAEWHSTGATLYPTPEGFEVAELLGGGER